MKQVTVHWLDAAEGQNGEVEMLRETEAWQANFAGKGRCLRVWKTEPAPDDYEARPDMMIPDDRVVKVVYEEAEGGE